VGAPRETFPNERRVSLTPQNVTLLKKKGFVNVLVEKHAGKEAQFLDEEYVAAGATMVSRDELFGNTDIMLKVRPPSVDKEAKTLKEGSTVISFLYPAQNKAVVDALATRKVNAFAMDMVPRISRAQTFDALRLASSISGHGQTRVNQPFTARWLILLATRLS
jgi:NAD(P) transhydrogenase